MNSSSMISPSLSTANVNSFSSLMMFWHRSEHTILLNRLTFWCTPPRTPELLAGLHPESLLFVISDCLWFCAVSLYKYALPFLYVLRNLRVCLISGIIFVIQIKNFIIVVYHHSYHSIVGRSQTKVHSFFSIGLVIPFMHSAISLSVRTSNCGNTSLPLIPSALSWPPGTSLDHAAATRPAARCNPPVQSSCHPQCCGDSTCCRPPLFGSDTVPHHPTPCSRLPCPERNTCKPSCFYL